MLVGPALEGSASALRGIYDLCYGLSLSGSRMLSQNTAKRYRAEPDTSFEYTACRLRAPH